MAALATCSPNTCVIPIPFAPIDSEVRNRGQIWKNPVVTSLNYTQMNFHKPSIVSLLSVSCFSRARLVPYCHCTVRGRRANIRHSWVEYLFHGPQQACRPFFGTTMVENNFHHCIVVSACRLWHQYSPFSLVIPRIINHCDKARWLADEGLTSIWVRQLSQTMLKRLGNFIGVTKWYKISPRPCLDRISLGTAYVQIEICRFHVASHVLSLDRPSKITVWNGRNFFLDSLQCFAFQFYPAAVMTTHTS